MSHYIVPRPGDLGRILIDANGRYVVNVEADGGPPHGYYTRRFRSLKRARRCADRVLRRESRREARVARARDALASHPGGQR